MTDCCHHPRFITVSAGNFTVTPTLSPGVVPPPWEEGGLGFGETFLEGWIWAGSTSAVSPGALRATNSRGAGRWVMHRVVTGLQH